MPVFSNLLTQDRRGAPAIFALLGVVARPAGCMFFWTGPHWADKERSSQTGADKNILDIAIRCHGVDGDFCLPLARFVFSAVPRLDRR